jgi:hypothetical protein
MEREICYLVFGVPYSEPDERSVQSLVVLL